MVGESCGKLYVAYGVLPKFHYLYKSETLSMQMHYLHIENNKHAAESVI